MAMVINTNIMSINAQNNLRTSQGDMNTAMERLSSGKRVNSAADDAAGLAIINRFTSQERGLNMAIRNANDGISMIQTAEGALDETTNILQRMRELAIQSANGIYSDANRATLNAEVVQLKAELTRIAETTSFNGLKILDGTLGDLDLQVGAESGEQIRVNLGSGFDAESLGSADGGVNTGAFTLAETTSNGQSGTSGTLEALSVGDLEINGVVVPAAQGSDDTLSTSDAGASALSIAAAINSVSDETGVVAEAGNAALVLDVSALAADAIEDDLVINGVTIADYTTTNDADADGAALAALINDESASTGVNAVYSAADDQLTLTAIDGRNLQIAIGDGDGATALNGLLGVTADTDTTYTGDVTLRSNEAIDIAGNDPVSVGFTAGGVEANTVEALQTTEGTSATMEITVTATDGTADYDTIPGELQINGVDIIFTSVDNDYDATVASLIAAINDVSGQTGVSAAENADGDGIDLSTGLGGTISVVSDPANDADSAVLGITGGTADILGAGTATGLTTDSASATGTDATFTNMTNGDLTINGYTVDFTNATSITTTSNERSTVDGGASAQFTALAINNTEGLKDQVTADAYTQANLGLVQAGTADTAFSLVVNGTVIDISGEITEGDTNGNLVGALNAAFNAAETADSTDDAGGLLASVNEDGELLITAEDGRNITVSVGGTANAAELLANFDTTVAGSVTAKGTITLTAKDGFTVGEVGGDKRVLAGIESGGDSIAEIDISTQSGAQAALDVVDRALDYIADARGDLGAASNRLSFTINNLSSVVENSAAARSRVQDADFAMESAALARAQVLQQAGTAMLAQANAAPQSVLSLLQ